MQRFTRDDAPPRRPVAAGRTAVVGTALLLALACSDGSGPGGGSTAGSIGGTVESGGTGVSGAAVALSGAATDNTTTAGDGGYLFDGLNAGAYTVTLTVPAGFALGPGENAAKPVTLGSGQDATVDWVLVAVNPNVGTIAGTVTAGGQGVPGATIALSGAGTGNTTTGSNGGYSFTDLDPGNYTVTVTLPAGFTLANGETAGKPATVTAGGTATVNWTAVAAGGGVTTVTLGGTSFTPGNVTITRGSTVRWHVNNGVHTVTPDNPNQLGVWTGTGALSTGEEFEHTFTIPGVYHYHCIPHESLGMVGTITVQ